MSTRITILMSDTGGGHRASAEAIREALETELNAEVKTEIIDVFLEYAPYPFRRFPDWYPTIISHARKLWGSAFHLSNGTLRSRAINYATWPLIRSGIIRLINECWADLIVSVHPLLVGPVLRGLGQSHPPFITVVTDLVTAHAWWFDKRTDLTLVPTEYARQRAVSCGLDPGRIRVLGLPVSKRFFHSADQTTLRRALGWSPDIASVLLHGGGDGMGPLREVATNLAHAGLPIQLAIVCGRNKRLQTHLESRSWPIQTHIYGFVHNMPQMMMATDLVVTKAGPSSVTEALACGRPLVLCSALPGQEEGNVSYVIDHGAGLWAPGPEKVVAAVRELVSTSPDRMAVMANKAIQLSRPDAASNIAKEICLMLPKLPI